MAALVQGCGKFSARNWAVFAIIAVTLFPLPVRCATLQAQLSVGITIVPASCGGGKACGAHSTTVAAPAAAAPNITSYSKQADGVVVLTRTY
jgi:hypothetical protein